MIKMLNKKYIIKIKFIGFAGPINCATVKTKRKIKISKNTIIHVIFNT